MGCERVLGVVLCCAVACKRTPQAFEPDLTVAENLDPAFEDVSGTRPVFSGVWAGGRYSLFIPPGWSGSSGPGARLLTIAQPATGFRMAVDESEPGAPGEGCYFDSRGSYRDVAVLGKARSRTCARDGRIEQMWYGLVEGRPLQVTVSYPEGSSLVGRQAVTPLLDGLVLIPEDER